MMIKTLKDIHFGDIYKYSYDNNIHYGFIVESELEISKGNSDIKFYLNEVKLLEKIGNALVDLKILDLIDD